MKHVRGSHRYDYEGSVSNLTASVLIAPVTSEFLAIRLKITESEAVQAAAERSANQAQKIPNLIGEFAIVAFGTKNYRTGQKAQIEALKLHAEELELGQQAYAIYKTDNFLPHGTLFGPQSTPAQLRVRDRREFYAAQTEHWREQLGSAHDNPFDHLIREKVGTPVLVAYDMAMLEPVDDGRLHGSTKPLYDSVVWRPIDGLTIEETVRIMYQPIV